MRSTAEKPLVIRSINFLRRAGLMAFITKSALFLRHRLSTVGAKRSDRLRQEQLQALVSQMPIVDGHIKIDLSNYSMFVQADDPGLGADLLLDGIREADAVEFITPLLRNCKSIIEIGANQGYYALLEGRHAAPDARIHAFEPHPNNVITLRKNIELNGFEHLFRVNEGAVSDTPGSAILHVNDRSNWHSLDVDLPQYSGGERESITVQTFTIDDYCKSHGIASIDLIRMDVEGHEFKILHGAAEMIRRSDSVLVFLELHTSILRKLGQDPIEMLEFCRTLGLRCIAVCGAGRVLRNPDHGHLCRELELIISKYGAHFFFMKKTNAT